MKTFLSTLTAAAVISVWAFSAAQAQAPSKMTAMEKCVKAVEVVKKAREDEAEIGDKSAKVFDELVALAEKRCEAGAYNFADQLLTIARGMVASE